jgi:hypothetical protein
MISLVKSDTKHYIRRLTEETGCRGYLFSSTPLEIDRTLFDRLNTAVPLLLDLLDTPAYFDHCIRQEHWSLPVSPMQLTDFTGCADFLLTGDGAKLIEMNINLPGKVGLMQTLSETARLYLGEPEAEWTNLGFNQDLIDTIREAIPVDGPIAIVVSHMSASKKHQPHYRWFSEQLNKAGLDTTVVQANELVVNPKGCTANGKEFRAVINLVIPFVWENNPIEFGRLTELWQCHSTPFFPNPTGGMFGTKDLLSYLSSHRGEPNAHLWSDFVLRAQLLTDFNTVEELTAPFPLSGMVLKPLKDYDTKGVYVQPDRATVEQLFLERKNDYMVQEFTSSVEVPFRAPSDETVTSHSVIYRIFFASKRPFGYQGYFIHGKFNGEYYTAPVTVAN